MPVGSGTPPVMSLLPWLVLTAAGCQNTPLRTDAYLEPCRALVSAPPAVWRERWQQVHALGPDASPALIRCLREDPEGAGRQAAIHLLGQWHQANPATDTFLRELVAARGADAAEAALAIGRRKDRKAVPQLVATVQDRTLATAVRTAAACALLDLDEPQHAVPLMRAVLLAASPYGADLEQEQGLPHKTRWALERYMIIEAVRRFSGGDTFGLDEDAPWPKLREGTAAFMRYVDKRQQRR